MKTFRRSLQFRIVALSGIWIILALLATGSLLYYYYQDHIGKHYDAHVLMHLEEMVAASHMTPGGEFILEKYPSDPRFNLPHSGWYWEIRHRGEVLKRSASLAGASLDLGHMQPGEGVNAYEIIGPEQAKLRVQMLQKTTGKSGESVLLIASAPTMRVSDDVIDIAEHMIVSFTVLGIGLILVVIFQVRLALRPLSSIRSGISEIREGKQDRLPDEYPSEVAPLVQALNNMIEQNAVLLKRARNQLGDLAHSIKNPLTIIKNEARNLPDDHQKLILRQVDDVGRYVDHYLFRARASGPQTVLGTQVNTQSVAEDLVFALQRIYQEKKLDIDISGLSGCAFRGDRQDLEEMLGNLMENACKWARSRVIVQCRAQAKRCLLSVQDDGPGIPEDQIERIMKRGQQLDESMQGHGQGLGIVHDLVELYNGTMTLGRSEHGGLHVELDIPGV